ncbi:50S ribosomal protein L18 [Candidatus Micrarchaeota archaeon]|jgi:large subunit ribosomal protein L18|nr:50S ribosomal protein L18 [Candidatus Micrarchaeota archaeon]
MAKATGPTYVVPFKRRRSRITNYKKRLGLIKSGLPRMVIRSSNKTIEVQFVQYVENGDKIVHSVNSNTLKKYGWNPKRNSPTAYLTSFLCATQAKKKGITDFVLDIGMKTPSKGAIIFIGAKGALDAGLITPFGEEKLIKERINGAHIGEYAKKLKQEDENKYKNIFSSYIKMGINPEEISKTFEEIREKLKKGGNE